MVSMTRFPIPLLLFTTAYDVIRPSLRLCEVGAYLSNVNNSVENIDRYFGWSPSQAWLNPFQ